MATKRRRTCLDSQLETKSNLNGNLMISEDFQLIQCDDGLDWIGFDDIPLIVESTQQMTENSNNLDENMVDVNDDGLGWLPFDDRPLRDQPIEKMSQNNDNCDQNMSDVSDDGLGWLSFDDTTVADQQMDEEIDTKPNESMTDIKAEEFTEEKRKQIEDGLKWIYEERVDPKPDVSLGFNFGLNFDLKNFKFKAPIDENQCKPKDKSIRKSLISQSQEVCPVYWDFSQSDGSSDLPSQRPFIRI